MTKAELLSHVNKQNEEIREADLLNYRNEEKIRTLERRVKESESAEQTMHGELRADRIKVANNVQSVIEAIDVHAFVKVAYSLYLMCEFVLLFKANIGVAQVHSMFSYAIIPSRIDGGICGVTHLVCTRHLPMKSNPCLKNWRYIL